MSTVGRTAELERFLQSLPIQGVEVFVSLTEQSISPSCDELLREHLALGSYHYVHEPVVRGLSRGRNLGLAQLHGGVVAFPDDDCIYPPNLLKSVLSEFDGAALDGISVRQITSNGDPSMIRWAEAPQIIRSSDVPRTVNSSTLFLTSEIVQRVGDFDPLLGVGAGTPFGAGEENDYVLRALSLGADIRYTPSLAVVQEDWRDGNDSDEVLTKVRKYNRGFGRVLRKHHMVKDAAYWILRSAAGVIVAVLVRRNDLRRQWQQLAGRVEGWLARDPF